MTTLQLLESMEKELKKVFSGMLFRRPSGEMGEIHVFQQDFPLKYVTDYFDGEQEEVDPDEDLFPYCVIRAESGEIEGNPQKVRMTLSFGICNRGMRNDGEIRILNLIERVSQRFISNRILDDRFVLDYETPIKWTLDQENNSYPYYFGMMEMTWNRPTIGNEEDIYA